MSNEKPQKECPFCEKVVSTHGLHTHVMNTIDEEHGDFREVPEGFKAADVPVIDPQPSPDRPEGLTHSTKSTASDHLYLCNWCNEIVKGERGYKTHLTWNSGDILHPEDASIEDQEYTLVPCDDDWNPLMDMEDVYRIQDRRRGQGQIGIGSTTRPIEEFSDQVDEQIAALLSNKSELEDEKERVMSILDCSEEEFQDGLKLYNEYVDYSEK